MRGYAGFDSPAYVVIGMSLAATAVVAHLVTTGVISPEWFFGVPVLGSVLTGVGFTFLRESDSPLRGDEVLDVVERFAETEQRLAAELEIRRLLDSEEARIVELLQLRGELEGVADYLGRDTLVESLRSVEDRRSEAMGRAEGLMRLHAVAHSELIVAAQLRGVQKAKSLQPDDLVSEVLRPAGRRGVAD